MADSRSSTSRAFSRREVLALGAGTAIAAMVPGARSLAAANPIPTRPIPRTGEALPVMGLGTAIVFDIGEDAARRSERAKVIQAMLEGGGRLIDTAPSYGTAEVVVGDLLAAAGLRDKVFLATKVRNTGREASIAEMQASLRRLRTDKLDLMQIHNPGTDAGMTREQLALLREWQARGVFRYLGVTHFREEANERLVELMRREKLDFVQVNFSLAERSAEQRLLAAAADTGTAVLVNLPFARGKLFAAVRGKPLPEWAADFGATSWAQFFLKWILGHPAVTCVIPGTDKPEFMLDNLNAARGRLPDAAMRKKMSELVDTLL